MFSPPIAGAKKVTTSKYAHGKAPPAFNRKNAIDHSGTKGFTAQDWARKNKLAGRNTSSTVQLLTTGAPVKKTKAENILTRNKRVLKEKQAMAKLAKEEKEQAQATTQKRNAKAAAAKKAAARARARGKNPAVAAPPPPAQQQLGPSASASASATLPAIMPQHYAAYAAESGEAGPAYQPHHEQQYYAQPQPPLQQQQQQFGQMPQQDPVFNPANLHPGQPPHPANAAARGAGAGGNLFGGGGGGGLFGGGGEGLAGLLGRPHQQQDVLTMAPPQQQQPPPLPPQSFNQRGYQAPPHLNHQQEAQQQLPASWQQQPQQQPQQQRHIPLLGLQTHQHSAIPHLPAVPGAAPVQQEHHQHGSGWPPQQQQHHQEQHQQHQHQQHPHQQHQQHQQRQSPYGRHSQQQNLGNNNTASVPRLPAVQQYGSNGGSSGIFGGNVGASAANDDDRTTLTPHQRYRLELDRQIAEKKANKAAEKLKEQQQEARDEAAYQGYNPWSTTAPPKPARGAAPAPNANANANAAPPPAPPPAPNQQQQQQQGGTDGSDMFWTADSLAPGGGVAVHVDEALRTSPIRERHEIEHASKAGTFSFGSGVTAADHESEQKQRVETHREILKRQHEEAAEIKRNKKEAERLQDVADKERVEREMAELAKRCKEEDEAAAAAKQKKIDDAKELTDKMQKARESAAEMRKAKIREHAAQKRDLEAENLAAAAAEALAKEIATTQNSPSKQAPTRPVGGLARTPPGHGRHSVLGGGGGHNDAAAADLGAAPPTHAVHISPPKRAVAGAHVVDVPENKLAVGSYVPRPPSGNAPAPAAAGRPRRKMAGGQSGIPRLKGAADATAQRKHEEIASFVKEAMQAEMQEMRESVLNLTAQLAAANNMSALNTTQTLAHHDPHPHPHRPDDDEHLQASRYSVSPVSDYSSRANSRSPTQSPAHLPEARKHKPKPPPKKKGGGGKPAGRNRRVAKLAKKGSPNPEHIPRVHGASRDASPSLSPVPHASESSPYGGHHSHTSPSPRRAAAASTTPTPHHFELPDDSATNHNIDRDDTSAADVLEQLRLARLRLNRKQRSIERELVVGADMLRQSGQVFAANDLAREQARSHLR